jgi:hypothetical protein
VAENPAFVLNIWRNPVQRDYVIDVNPILNDIKYPTVKFVTTDKTASGTRTVGGGEITVRALRYSLRLEKLLRTDQLEQIEQYLDQHIPFTIFLTIEEEKMAEARLID